MTRFPLPFAPAGGSERELRRKPTVQMGQGHIERSNQDAAVGRSGVQAPGPRGKIFPSPNPRQAGFSLPCPPRWLGILPAISSRWRRPPRPPWNPCRGRSCTGPCLVGQASYLPSHPRWGGPQCPPWNPCRGRSCAGPRQRRFQPPTHPIFTWSCRSTSPQTASPLRPVRAAPARASHTRRRDRQVARRRRPLPLNLEP